MTSEAPMGFMLRCLELSGILFTKEKRKKWWARFLSIYFLATETFGFIPIFINLFTVKDFFKDALETTNFILDGGLAGLKHLNILFRQDSFLELFGEIQSLWKEAEMKSNNKPYMDMVCIRSTKKTKLIYTSLWIAFIVMSTGMTFFNYMLTRRKKAALQLWLPLDPEQYGILLCSGIQFMIVATGIFSFFTHLALLISLFEHIFVLMELLIKEISVTEPLPTQKKIDIIVTHSRIINIVNKLRDLLGWLWLLETILGAANITLRGYMCLKTAKEQDPMFFYGFVTFIVVVWARSLLYIRGSKLTILSEGIRDAIYNLPWNEQGIKDRKDVLFMLSVANKPLTLNYKLFIMFDNEQFLNVLRAAFSYLTMLQVFDDS